MELDEDGCWARMAEADHGVLATMHRRRGVDAVPVVFVRLGDTLLVPIDSVKRKRTTRLQRLDNIRGDPRCVLLVDSYDRDWSRLWWVRLHAHATETAPTDTHRKAFAQRYPQYEAPDSIVSVIVLEPVEITGWSAS